jgi:hypothetical protein
MQCSLRISIDQPASRVVIGPYRHVALAMVSQRSADVRSMDAIVISSNLDRANLEAVEPGTNSRVRGRAFCSEKAIRRSAAMLTAKPDVIGT